MLKPLARQYRVATYLPLSLGLGNTIATNEGHFFAPWRHIGQTVAPDFESQVTGTELTRAAWICKIYKEGSGKPSDILAFREARLQKIRNTQKGIN